MSTAAITDWSRDAAAPQNASIFVPGLSHNRSHELGAPRWPPRTQEERNHLRNHNHHFGRDLTKTPNPHGPWGPLDIFLNVYGPTLPCDHPHLRYLFPAHLEQGHQLAPPRYRLRVRLRENADAG